jgi:chemotaxis protein CheD
MNGSPDAVLAAPAQAGYFLGPGQVHCATVPTVVSTVLGSCVAVCLWDRAARVGGMNHFVLPHHNQHGLNPRFGDVAIDELVHAMLRLGCDAGRLRAKVFGGATVLPFGRIGDTVGSQNVLVALESLRACGIPVIARRTGGRSGLLIRLHTGTGEVLLRRLGSLPSQADFEQMCSFLPDEGGDLLAQS